MIPRSCDNRSLVSVLITIVTFNNSAHILSCLERLVLCNYPNFGIFVIDNNSIDNSYEILLDFQKKLSTRDIYLCSNVKNEGFAAGVNKGLKYALEKGFDYALLLNPDTIVHPNFLSKLINTAVEDEKVGIVGGKILFLEENRVYAAGGCISYFRNVGHNLCYLKPDSPKLTGTIDASFVSGALMLLKTEMVRQIGLFDEGYFMYLEDADYCYRARKAGWKIKVNLDAIVWHREGASSERTFASYWASRNRLRFIFKNLSKHERVMAVFLHLLSKPFFYIKIKKPDLIRADVRGFIDFFTKELTFRTKTF